MKIEYTKDSKVGNKILSDFADGSVVKVNGYDGVYLISDHKDSCGDRLLIDVSNGESFYPHKGVFAQEVFCKLVIDGSEDD